MKGWKLWQAADACGGTYIGDAALLDEPIRGITIDSRITEPGCLFVATKGERFDGHDFIDGAYENGALCCVSERPVNNHPHILVPNALRALQDIAGFYRGLFDIPFIGITGSVGKTSTKEMIAGVLARGMDVHKTQGNLNNQTGVPLTLFMLKETHRAAVVEMGANHFGEIDAVAKITRPDYCFLTGIGDAHIENFGDRQGTLRAKCEMLAHIRPGGKVFVNGDDKLLRPLKDNRDDVITYGLLPRNDIYAEAVEDKGLMGTEFTAVAYGRRMRMYVPSPGAHMVLNALAGVAAGLALGISEKDIAKGVAAYAPVGSRMDIIGVGGGAILNDVYNANPQSVMAALEVLGRSAGRKVAILGDMYELGDNAPELHRNIGKLAAETADLVIGVGRLAGGICEGASGRKCRNMYFLTQESLIVSLPQIIKQGDAVLVKASRGMRMEETVQFLRDNSELFG